MRLQLQTVCTARDCEGFDKALFSALLDLGLRIQWRVGEGSSSSLLGIVTLAAT